jgi:hypothetical protein
MEINLMEISIPSDEAAHENKDTDNFLVRP